MPTADPETLQMILEHYRSSAAEREHEELWWKAEELSFPRACERAAKAIRENGKIHSHHRRPGRVVMSNFASAVVAAARRLQQAAEFDDLLKQVEDLAKVVPGTGELVAYDVADIQWDRALATWHEKALGVIYTSKAKQKPVVAARTARGLQIGSVYYRYRGHNETIRPGDLFQMLADRDQQVREGLNGLSR